MGLGACRRLNRLCLFLTWPRMRTAAAARTISHRFGNRQHIRGSLGNFRLAAYPLSLRSMHVGKLQWMTQRSVLTQYCTNVTNFGTVTLSVRRGNTISTSCETAVHVPFRDPTCTAAAKGIGGCSRAGDLWIPGRARYHLAATLK